MNWTSLLLSGLSGALGAAIGGVVALAIANALGLQRSARELLATVCAVLGVLGAVHLKDSLYQRERATPLWSQAAPSPVPTTQQAASPQWDWGREATEQDSGFKWSHEQRGLARGLCGEHESATQRWQRAAIRAMLADARLPAYPLTPLTPAQRRACALRYYGVADEEHVALFGP